MTSIRFTARWKTAAAAICSVLISALMASGALSAAGKAAPSPQCLNCHVKKNPVPGDSKLKQCPGFHQTKMPNNPPSVMVLSTLAKEYQAVSFSHGTHADMARMGDGCWTCHHNSPTDKPLPPCKSCHPEKPSSKNPSVIKLEAAYHRHCIFCHKSWSGKNDCEMCHLKRGSTKAKVKSPPKPVPVRPEKKIYKTPYKGTSVSFFHNDHINLFRLSCQDCHIKTDCSACHEGKGQAVSVDIETGVCARCHPVKDPASCDKCHSAAPVKAFAHNYSKFPLKPYHSNLKCDACHHAHEPLSSISSDCMTCHKGLKFNNFDHAATGFSLKPYHSKVPCQKCHPSGSQLSGLSKNCFDCHKSKHLKGFDHSSTGTNLRNYHRNADCEGCHRGDIKRKVNESDCFSCHGRDDFSSFDHKKSAGVRFDDMHSSIDCGDCHPSGFDKKTSCTGCHDENIAYPEFHPEAP